MIKNKAQGKECHDCESTGEFQVECDSARTMEDLNDFFRHFEIDQMITPKCISVMCFKLRNQRFCLKQLIDGLNDDMFPGKLYRDEENSPLMKLDLMKPWIDVLPQLPGQNFLQCYGVTRIKDKYYTICDLVEDNKPVSFQKTELDAQKRFKDEHEEEDESHHHSSRNLN